MQSCEIPSFPGGGEVWLEEWVCASEASGPLVKPGQQGQEEEKKIQDGNG